MTLAGKKTSELKFKTLEKVYCPSCNSKNTTRMAVTGTYKHLFHIPFLSGGKQGKSVCSNCNHTLEFSQMPDNLKLAYYELKEISKTPYWHYSGLIAIKLLVLIKIFSKYL